MRSSLFKLVRYPKHLTPKLNITGLSIKTSFRQIPAHLPTSSYPHPVETRCGAVCESRVDCACHTHTRARARAQTHFHTSTHTFMRAYCQLNKGSTKGCDHPTILLAAAVPFESEFDPLSIGVASHFTPSFAPLCRCLSSPRLTPRAALTRTSSPLLLSSRRQHRDTPPSHPQPAAPRPQLLAVRLAGPPRPGRGAHLLPRRLPQRERDVDVLPQRLQLQGPPRRGPPPPARPLT